MCNQCHAVLKEQARFCPQCGARQEEAQEEHLAASPSEALLPAASQAHENAMSEPEREDMPPDENESDATIRVTPHSRRAGRSRRKTTTASTPLRSQSRRTTIPLSSHKSNQTQSEKVPANQEPIVLAEQPATVIELDALHLYHSVPLARAPEQPLQAEQPTIPVPNPKISHPELFTPDGNIPGQAQNELSPFQHTPPLLYYKLNTTTKGSQMLPAVINPANSKEEGRRRKRSRGGCVLGCLTVLILLLVVLGAGWIFVARPYAHNIAETQLDKAMTAAVDQMPTTLTKILPPGSVLPVNENTINNLIVLNLAPSNPVQKPVTSITPERIRLSFELYGYPSAISFVPTLDKTGRLVANNVNVEGVLGLIMSPDELKPLLDKHFADAQNKIGRTIKDVKLKDHEIDITL